MQWRFLGNIVDPDILGISCVSNVGHATSERTNELLDANIDRINAFFSRHLNVNDLPRTKILQKVEDFGFLEILIHVE